MDTFPSPPPPQQNTTFSLSNISPSVFIITIIIASTIILSISLCFLLRLLRHKTDTSIAPDPIPSPHSNTARTTINTNNTLLNSLPLFTFSSITQRRRSNNNNIVGDCAVCLSKFEEHDKLRLLPLCCHAFHAECIDTWLVSNESCPICRAGVRVTESELLKVFGTNGGNGGGGSGSGSFRLELGSVSRRRREAEEGSGEVRSAYSIGSFDYVVEDESEVTMSDFSSRVEKEENDFPASVMAAAGEEDELAAEIGGGRSWLKDYVDRWSASISSRTASFRSSGRFFTGSSRWNDVPGVPDYDLEANRIGEEISELFRWFSAV